MIIAVSNRILLNDIPAALDGEIRDRLTFRNPQWEENRKRGFWNGNTPEYLHGYESTESGLVIPRGFARQLLTLCGQHGAEYQLIDQRRTLPPVDFQFRGNLKDFQDRAVKAVLSRDFGTLQAPTGAGKTVMALSVIADRNQPALIIVHTKVLLNQWISRIETFLGIPADEVGIIGNGKKRIGNLITVAMVQTLYKCAKEVAPHIGHVIVDEAHRVPSRTFTDAITAFDSRFMLGLSATLYRRDKLTRLIYWHLGDLVHEVPKDELVDNGDILKPEVITRETAFTTRLDPSGEYSKMLSELTQDSPRNRLIARDVAKEARNGSGVCLVLSDRKGHCEALRGLLARDYGISCELLTGDLSKTQRESVIDRLNRGRVKVLVATGQLIGEGFDCKGLTTLFLCTPIKFSGRVLQYLGRVLRPAPGKDKAVVYDYIDLRIGILVTAAKARSRVYRQS